MEVISIGLYGFNDFLRFFCLCLEGNEQEILSCISFIKNFVNK